MTFTNEAGTNQEGLYWRYEMWLRAQESALASVTGGNGAIYAVRREAYVEVDPIMGHDLSFPFQMVKDGRRAVYQPSARATEKMVPSIEGEWAAQAADDVPRLADRGQGRARRPARLPAAVRADDRLATGCCATGRRSCTSLTALATLALLRRGRVYRLAALAQAALVAAALLAARARSPRSSPATTS